MNKTFQILASSFLLMVICNVALAKDRRPHTDDDHMIPVNGRIEVAYEKLLNRRLFVTRANYARIVTLASPASVGELAIAIYSKRNNENEAWITITRAERNLWAAEFGEDPSFPKVPAVKVTRRDASFPTSTATAVSTAIGRMLDQSRPLSKNGRIIVDATDIEFSLEKQQGRRVRALLTPDAQGPQTSALRRLTRLIEEYCEAPPAMQPNIAKQIETEAKRR